MMTTTATATNTFDREDSEGCKWLKNHHHQTLYCAIFEDREVLVQYAEGDEVYDVSDSSQVWGRVSKLSPNDVVLLAREGTSVRISLDRIGDVFTGKVHFRGV